MTKSKVGPLAVLRGSTHFEDVCGHAVRPTQYITEVGIWTSAAFSSVDDVRRHLRQSDILARNGLGFEDEIAFEVYDDEE